MRHQLVRLDFHVLSDILLHALSFQTLSNISRIEMSNLKKLSLDWFNVWDTNRSVRNLFLHFTYLTKVNCKVGPELYRGIQISIFIRLILNSATELRSLIMGISHRARFRIDKNCFVAIVRSKLKALKIYFEHEDIGSTFSYSHKSYTYTRR